MSSDTKNILEVEELLAELDNDGINIQFKIIENARRKEGSALYQIGTEYYKKQLYTKAIAWYQLSASKNNPDAQYVMGSMYEDGLGVTADDRAAMDWYLKAAKQRHIKACTSIGRFFENGKSVAMNKHKAAEWFYKDLYNERLKQEGYSLTNQEKEKTVYELIEETEEILKNEKDDVSTQKRDTSNGQILLLEQAFKQELRNINDKMKKMENENQEIKNAFQTLKQSHQSLIETMDGERKSGKEALDKIIVLENRIQALETSSDLEQKKTLKQIEGLEQANNTLSQSLEQMNTKLDTAEKQMQKIIENLREENTELKNKTEILQQSNANIILIADQERRIRNNDEELMKQENRKALGLLEEENKSMKEKLESLQHENKGFVNSLEKRKDENEMMREYLERLVAKEHVDNIKSMSSLEEENQDLRQRMLALERHVQSLGLTRNNSEGQHNTESEDDNPNNDICYDST